MIKQDHFVSVRLARSDIFLRTLFLNHGKRISFQVYKDNKYISMQDQSGIGRKPARALAG